MTNSCAYCESDVTKHDPVVVEKGEGPARETAGWFCNYACLSAYIDEEQLATGDCCRWEPSD